MEKNRCQSCGQPVGHFVLPGGTPTDNFGTEKDGSHTPDYCSTCYKDGAFVEPDLPLEEMVKRSVRYMTHDLKLPDEQADVMAHAVIPTLKRWRTGS